MTPGCYWEHGTPQNLHYLCLDGESTVCPRCCVEVCPVKAPEWFAACAASGHPTWPSVRRAVPMKLVCLESAWDTKAFGNLSVRGFFEAMRPLIHPPLQLAYRPIESARHLAHYTRKPDGVLWTDPEAFDAPIFYLAFHGAPGSITSMLEPIGPEALCEAFQGYGGYDNLIYLASCSVLRGPEGRTFGEELLRTSGSRAVIGYTTDVEASSWTFSSCTASIRTQTRGTTCPPSSPRSSMTSRPPAPLATPSSGGRGCNLTSRSPRARHVDQAAPSPSGTRR